MDNNVEGMVDRGDSRSKKARTKVHQDNSRIREMSEHPAIPEDTTLGAPNPDVIHVTKEDHFIVQEEGFQIIAPFTYMSVDGFLATSTVKGLSFHSWARHNRGIALGRQMTKGKSSGRGARGPDKVTCNIIAASSSSIPQSSNTLSRLAPSLFKALFGDERYVQLSMHDPSWNLSRTNLYCHTTAIPSPSRSHVLITGTDTGAVHFQRIVEGLRGEAELATTLPEPIYAIYTTRIRFEASPRHQLAVAFLGLDAGGNRADEKADHNALLVVGQLGTLAVFATKPPDADASRTGTPEQGIAYKEYHLASRTHASAMVGSVLLLSVQDGQVVVVPLEGEAFAAGLPTMLHTRSLPSLKSIVGLAGGRRSDRDGTREDEGGGELAYAISRGGRVSKIEVVKSVDVHPFLPRDRTAATLQAAIKDTLGEIAQCSEAQERISRAHESINVSLVRTNEILHNLQRLRTTGRRPVGEVQDSLFRCELRPVVMPPSMARAVPHRAFVRIRVWSKLGVAWEKGWCCIPFF
ncbi:hypothetical protein BC938DRAFT_470862, partial [Jimgerdemannia flammicorona]